MNTEDVPAMNNVADDSNSEEHFMCGWLE